MTELIGLRYSPYTEKARWALDVHGIDYHYTEHLMMLGMPALRWKTKKPSRELTVPALISPDRVLCDSFEIAKYADARANHHTLFPESNLKEIERINNLSELALDAGRALMVYKLSENKAAQREYLPPFIPNALRGGLRFLVPLGLKYVKREFDVADENLDLYALRFADALTSIREKLRAVSYRYLLGEFSYADIALAVVLQMVKPVDAKFIPLGVETRRCWTQPELAEEFADLLEWRDRLYEKHRFVKIDS